MKKIILFLVCFNGFSSLAQRQIDSLLQLLSTVQEDTNKINILNSLGYKFQYNDPKKSIDYCLAALSLSQKLHDKIGELNALFSMGEALAVSGNFTKATEVKFKLLEESEKYGDEFRLGRAYISIASGYFYQEEYEETIRYTRKAMANPNVLKKAGLQLYGFLGESYYKLNQLDSALYYTQRSYEIDVASDRHWSVPYFTLAGIHAKRKQYELALEFYRLGIHDDSPKKDIVDGHLGLATIFSVMGNTDSALFYAKKVIEEGQLFSLQSEVLDGAILATKIYKNNGLRDSMFFYQQLVLDTKDSLFSQQKMREVQNLKFSELLRQQEIEEKILLEQEERKNNLQYAAIAIGLITFVILFLALSRSIIVKEKFIEFFGVLGLLAVFEFINLFIHPYLDELTNHSPVLMLLILIAIGALLVPLHHKLEKWITKIMVEKNKRIRLAAAKKTIAALEGENSK